jgi:hypothetical protein
MRMPGCPAGDVGEGVVEPHDHQFGHPAIVTWVEADPPATVEVIGGGDDRRAMVTACRTRGSSGPTPMRSASATPSTRLPSADAFFRRSIDAVRMCESARAATSATDRMTAAEVVVE